MLSGGVLTGLNEGARFDVSWCGDEGADLMASIRCHRVRCFCNFVVAHGDVCAHADAYHLRSTEPSASTLHVASMTSRWAIVRGPRLISFTVRAYGGHRK